MTNEEFGITLMACLEKEQIIQKELAERINRSPQAVSKWANGKSMPDVETFGILDKMLHIRQNYPLIFNGTYEENKCLDQPDCQKSTTQNSIRLIPLAS